MKRHLATPPGTRFKKNEVETITNLIKYHVNMMNLAMRDNESDAFERFRAETMGMLICLKNISEENRFYCINIFDDRTEFGFYDNDSKWNVIS